MVAFKILWLCHFHGILLLLSAITTAPYIQITKNILHIAFISSKVLRNWSQMSGFWSWASRSCFLLPSAKSCLDQGYADLLLDYALGLSLLHSWKHRNNNDLQAVFSFRALNVSLWLACFLPFWYPGSPPLSEWCLWICLN